MSKNFWDGDRRSRLFPSLVGMVLFGISIWAIRQELHQYSFHEELQSLASIPSHYLFLAVGLTALNYATLTGYDTLAVRYVHRPLAYHKTALVALVACAISNSVGLSLLSSSAIRYRFYSGWGLSAIEVAHVAVFCSLSFWLGLFAVGSVIFILSPLTVPTLLHLPFNSVHPIGIVFLAVLVIYLLWNSFSQVPFRIGALVFPHLPVELALVQIAIASLDWLLTAAILYALLPSAVLLSYPVFLEIYLLAQIAGIFSNVPGGLGVFETVILLLLSSTISPTISPVIVFGALLAYRGIYFFLPLGLAALLIGLYELQQRFSSKSSLL